MKQRYGDLTGRRFEKWTVLEFAFHRAKQAYWRCRCVCGNVRAIYAGNLIRRTSTRCRECCMRADRERRNAWNRSLFVEAKK